MKKNITINMSGNLYSIDEDAYVLLKKYLDALAEYFGDGVDGRMLSKKAETALSERIEKIKANGKHIIEMDDVIMVIKNDNTEYAAPEHKLSSKMFRDCDAGVFGGVLSGISNYIGFNITFLLRLVFAALSFVPVVPLLYIILWIALPMAESPVDKLRMKGLEVNVERLREIILREASARNNNDDSSMNTVMMVVGFCLKIFFGIVIAVVMLMLCIAIVMFVTHNYIPFAPIGMDDMSRKILEHLMRADAYIAPLIMIFFFSAFIAAGIILFSIIHSVVSRNTGRRLSSRMRMSLVAMSVGLIIAAVFTGMSAERSIDNKMDVVKKEKSEIMQRMHDSEMNVNK